MKKVVGFEMGNIWYNEPKTLDVFFDVLGDIILATASQQYGGFTVPEVDKLAAPYAEKSYKKYVDEYMEIRNQQTFTQEVHEWAMQKVERDFEQGFQGIEMKLNTVGLEKTITNASDTEQGIVEAESARVEVEKKRVSAEQGRVDAESERVAAETARVQAETKRQQDTSKAITDCNTATDSALKAAATMMIVNDDTGKTYQGAIKVIGGKPVFEYDEVVTG